MLPLKVLDLSYNNLSENSLPSNFFIMATLRALYLSDNEFEQLSPEIRNLKNLRILALRDNELVDLPQVFYNISECKKKFLCYCLCSHFYFLALTSTKSQILH